MAVESAVTKEMIIQQYVTRQNVQAFGAKLEQITGKKVAKEEGRWKAVPQKLRQYLTSLGKDSLAKPRAVELRLQYTISQQTCQEVFAKYADDKDKFQKIGFFDVATYGGNDVYDVYDYQPNRLALMLETEVLPSQDRFAFYLYPDCEIRAIVEGYAQGRPIARNEEYLRTLKADEWCQCMDNGFVDHALNPGAPDVVDVPVSEDPCGPNPHEDTTGAGAHDGDPFHDQESVDLSQEDIWAAQCLMELKKDNSVFEKIGEKSDTPSAGQKRKMGQASLSPQSS